MTELFAFDEREVVQWQAKWDLADELSADPQLSRMREIMESDRAAGLATVSDGYNSNIVELKLAGDEAEVLDCSSSDGFLYDGDEILERGDGSFKLRQTLLSRVDGRWLVTDTRFGGSLECTPPG